MGKGKGPWAPEEPKWVKNKLPVMPRVSPDQQYWSRHYVMKEVTGLPSFMHVDQESMDLEVYVVETLCATDPLIMMKDRRLAQTKWPDRISVYRDMFREVYEKLNTPFMDLWRPYVAAKRSAEEKKVIAMISSNVGSASRPSHQMIMSAIQQGVISHRQAMGLLFSARSPGPSWVSEHLAANDLLDRGFLLKGLIALHLNLTTMYAATEAQIREWAAKASAVIGAEGDAMSAMRFIVGVNELLVVQDQ